MSEAEKRRLGCNFDSSVRLAFHGATIASDAGLAIDPAVRCVVGGRAVERRASSPSQIVAGAE